MYREVKLLIAGLGLIATALGRPALAGPYSGPTDTAHPVDPGIPSSSPLFVEWADQILPLGAGTYFAPRGSTSISLTGYNSLGDLDAAQIANGDSPGYLTVTFPTGIRDGAGADFAVFENGFTYGSPNGLFAELAYVEVSSNGTDFVRFDSISTNTAPVAGSGAFAGYDMSNVYNLAGKHASGYGTPFDLAQLASNPLVLSGQVNLGNIQYVRLRDIPGNGSFLDSLGNPILDNWMTTGSGGFDFRLPAGQGIGVINVVPEPVALILLGLGGLLVIRRRRIHIAPVLAIMLAVGMAVMIGKPVRASDWTQFHGDAAHAGYAALGPNLASYTTPRFQVGSGLGSGFMGTNSSSPVVMNGSIFVYRGSGAVTAFSETDGEQLWSTPVAEASFGSWSSPSTDPASNSVYIGSGEYVYRLNATTGQEIWRYHLTTMAEHGETYASVVNASPTINADAGLVYIHTYGSFGGGTRLHAINVSDGSVAWTRDLTGQGQGAVAYNAAQDLIYTTVGISGTWSSGRGGIQAFNATTGTDAWLSEGSFEPLSFGGIAYDTNTNRVVAGGYDFYSYAGMLTANGSTGQTISYTGDDTSPSGDFTPTFGDDNLVYVTGAEFQDGPFVMAFNTVTGQEAWRSEPGWGGWNQSVIYAANDGTGRDVIYCGDQYGTRYGMFDADTGSLLASYPTGGGPGALANGNLYFLSGDGQLLAFGPAVPEPATAILLVGGALGLLGNRRKR